MATVSMNPFSLKGSEHDIEDRVSGYDPDFLFMIVKNLLFWGSCAVSIAVIWSIVHSII